MNRDDVIDLLFPSPSRDLFFIRRETGRRVWNKRFPSPTRGLFFYSLNARIYCMSQGFRPLLGVYFFISQTKLLKMSVTFSFRPLFGAYFLICRRIYIQKRRGIVSVPCLELSFSFDLLSYTRAASDFVSVPFSGLRFLCEKMKMFLNYNGMFPSSVRGLGFYYQKRGYNESYTIDFRPILVA